MRLYNKFCRSPGHRFPKPVEKIYRVVVADPLRCNAHFSLQIVPSSRDLVSSAVDSSQLWVSIFKRFHKVDQKLVVVW